MVEQTRVWQGRKTMCGPRPFVSPSALPDPSLSLSFFCCIPLLLRYLGMLDSFCVVFLREKRECFYLKELAFVFVQGQVLFGMLISIFRWPRLIIAGSVQHQHQTSKTQLDTHTGKDTRERREGHWLLFFSFAGFEEGIRQLLSNNPLAARSQ